MSGNRELVGSLDGKQATFTFNENEFTVSCVDNKGKLQYESTPYHVVWAEYNQGTLELYFLEKKDKNSRFSLVHLVVSVEDDVAREWSETLMQTAYLGIKPRRRLKVLINPYSGSRKSPMLFTKIVEPILRAGRCTVNVTYTEHAKHAQQICKELPLDYDAVLTLSGDGLAHEVLNGFAQHADPKNVFSIPLAPIPTGSANGTCISLLGLKDGHDVALATLNAVKGRPMRVDLCSVTQKDKRTFSYMSQATGLMADLDVGTNHLRWMGSVRFAYGYIRGLVANQPCPITISVKISERDKYKLIEDYQSIRDSKSKIFGSALSRDELLQGQEWSPLPRLKYSKEDKDGWIDIETPILFLYAGKGPFASSDLMQWPVSLPDDGLVDVVLQEVTSRTEMFKAMAGAEKGDAFWMTSQHYLKAEAYRVKTHGPGNLSVDGEEMPFGDFEVEVHKGMAAFLSPFGHYAAEFHPSPPTQK